MATCREAGNGHCTTTKTDLRRGLCRAHYAKAHRAKALGELLVHARPQCKHDDCALPHKAKGYCSKHYQWHRNRALGKKIHKVNEHGYSRYVNAGCRCDVCVAGQKEYRAAWTRAAREETAAKGWNGNHGTNYAYTRRGCRCDVCMAWLHSKRTTGDDGMANKNNGWPRQVRTELTTDINIVHWVPAGTGVWSCPDCEFSISRDVASNQRDAA